MHGVTQIYCEYPLRAGRPLVRLGSSDKLGVARPSWTVPGMSDVELIGRSPPPVPRRSERERAVSRIDGLRRLCAELRQRLAAQQATRSRPPEALVASAVAA